MKTARMLTCSRGRKFFKLAIFFGFFILLPGSSAHSQDPQAEHLSHHPDLAAQATAQPQPVQAQPQQKQIPAAASSGQQAAPNVQSAAPPMAAGPRLVAVSQSQRQPNET